MVFIHILFSNCNLQMTMTIITFLDEIRSKSAGTLQIPTPIIIIHTTSASSISNGTHFPTCSETLE